jgi:hypothetical protein
LAGVGPNALVLVPGFICRDILSAPAALQAQVQFYEVDASLRPIDSDRWPMAEAVLAVNYFGFPQDLEPFRRYCEKSGAVLIEDNAHGLFSRDAEGRFLGTRGDFGIFSLRKSLALPNGAALWASPERKATLTQGDFDLRSNSRYLAKQAFRILAGKLGASASFQLLETLRRSRRPDSKGSEKELPFPDRPTSILAKPLAIADPAAETSRRRQLYESAAEKLFEFGIYPLFKELPSGTVPYGLPFRIPAADRKAVVSHFAKWGLNVLPWPDLPDAMAARAPEHYRDISLIHFLW